MGTRSVTFYCSQHFSCDNLEFLIHSLKKKKKKNSTKKEKRRIVASGGRRRKEFKK